MCEHSGIKIICTKYIYVLGACYNNDFYITNSKFQIDDHLLVLYVNNTDFLYASKYTQSNPTASFWFRIVSIHFTSLCLKNIKFLFHILMYLLMTIDCARFRIKIIMYRYIYNHNSGSK